MKKDQLESKTDDKNQPGDCEDSTKMSDKLPDEESAGSKDDKEQLQDNEKNPASDSDDETGELLHVP